MTSQNLLFGNTRLWVKNLGVDRFCSATELDPEIKVMFITGFAAVALNPDNKAPKDARILSKPFHLRDLVNEVQKVLAA